MFRYLYNFRFLTLATTTNLFSMAENMFPVFRTIRSNLEADLIFETNDVNLSTFINHYEAELQSTILCSHVVASVTGDSPGAINVASKLSFPIQGYLKVHAHVAQTHKCPRCWNFWSESKDSLCFRCDQVITLKQR
jgi:isoleucyl-tRNA synthetase